MMRIKEVFVKCPHCGSDEGYILGRCGCMPGREFYFWCCCGASATKGEWTEVLTRVTDNLEEAIRRSFEERLALQESCEHDDTTLAEVGWRGEGVMWDGIVLQVCKRCFKVLHVLSEEE